MPVLRIALAETDPVGRDAEEALAAARRARDAGADLLGLGEAAAPVDDGGAVFPRAVRDRLDAFAGRLGAERMGDLPVLVGFAVRRSGETPRRCAAVLFRGAVAVRQAESDAADPDGPDAGPIALVVGGRTLVLAVDDADGAALRVVADARGTRIVPPGTDPGTGAEVRVLDLPAGASPARATRVLLPAPDGERARS